MKYTTLVLLLVMFTVNAAAQTTEFTYQGSLRDGMNAATGNYDFEFRLFDAVSGGSQFGSTLTRSGIPVANGIFAVPLDFGFTFPGPNRFLEIRVRNAGGGAFTLLDPRQKVTTAPYSIRSVSAESANEAQTAATANNALALGGVAANQFVVTTDPRMTNDRPPTAGSGNYVQNTSTTQAATNFNISGNGTAGGTLSGATVNATTQYNINGERILSTPGTNNVFLGQQSGISSPGFGNTFVGRSSGLNNTGGNDNTFVGAFAGFDTSSGSQNSFFGAAAGRNSAGGSNNSFFGTSAGRDTFSSNNSFFGHRAGDVNSIGTLNSFFGQDAGGSNISGNQNSFFGASAGRDNIGGDSNVYLGYRAGILGTSGNSNTVVGTDAGFNIRTGSRNTFVGFAAGRDADSTVDNSAFGYLAGAAITSGINNAFFGENAGASNTNGTSNSFFGQNSGSATTTGDNNSFFGKGAGTTNVGGNNNTLIGYDAETTSGSLSYATAIGADASVGASNTIALGRSSAADRVLVYGILEVNGSGTAGSSAVCRNAAGQIGLCSSSLRYKTNINSYGLGLNLINQLKPITFDWKDGGMHDLGLGAEDVAAIEPLLVTYNKDGQIEGVKYDRIGVVLVNAVKEQQAQIDVQRSVMAAQQRQINEMKALLCTTNKNAEICKEIR